MPKWYGHMRQMNNERQWEKARTTRSIIRGRSRYVRNKGVAEILQKRGIIWIENKQMRKVNEALSKCIRTKTL